MEIYNALDAFSSLSQETRLRVFKFMIEFGSDGVVAGKIARELKIPDNTLSFHLSHMTKAGLVSSRREGRSIHYSANTKMIRDLISFLQENCCVREAKGKKERKCI